MYCLALNYQLGDIFVSASTNETQGLTYIETAANGLPLLCRRDPCLDGVLAGGRNGWVYESEEEFCDIILLLINLSLQQKTQLLLFIPTRERENYKSLRLSISRAKASSTAREIKAFTEWPKAFSCPNLMMIESFENGSLALITLKVCVILINIIYNEEIL